MGNILIQNTLSAGVTIISNQFINIYMPQANGEFVKVYLYLLHLTQDCASFSLASVADIFDCTERDITRALRYWEKAGLMQLTCENRKLTGIAFCDFPAADKAAAPQETLAAEEVSAAADPELSQPQTAAAAEPAPQPKTVVKTPAVKTEAPTETRRELSAGKKKELQEKEDVRQFLYIAEQYLGRTLTRTDIDNLLYYYAELDFSADLIEYLVEYCVSKGSRSTRYIETVALAWAEEGISSVTDAKKSTNMYNKNYFTILKALGIKNRNPVDAELKFMDNWLRDLAFSIDIITEACSRTVMQTGQASFQYADSILQDWSKKGIKHLTDVETLDKEHKARSAKAPAKDTPKKDKGNKFNEYPHREYDYDEIKKSLFNQ